MFQIILKEKKNKKSKAIILMNLEVIVLKREREK